MYSKLNKIIIAIVLVIILALTLIYLLNKNDFHKPLEYRSDYGSRKFIEVKFQMAFTEEEVEFIAEVVDSLVITEGDIILGTLKDFELQGFAAVTGEGKLWDRGIIPYVIESNHPKKDEILKAIEEINTKTKIKLLPRLNERDYVYFMNKPNCASYVGRQKDGQVIECGNCSYGSIIHEILHAAGFYHEHTRKDRGKYIIVNEENIEINSSDNFRRYIDRFLSGKDIKDYDYNSIMHYDEYSFSKNGKKTIEVKKLQQDSVIKIGQRDSLSDGDIRGINITYHLKQ
ncbi:M12 family metallopeptidase [Winogradskyella aquimaris]|uniref:M12 family metallopeptidase n=1 Tax=Winogradskyella aquimaris TaxID=864074 RepID=A0ABU5EPV2_9FLAO|nr:M12 family metallopeptidase [Winogradskyella aquimaris]MDY2586784.1 M12 family metallopeptidase [Winogradskyella aquimaris]